MILVAVNRMKLADVDFDEITKFPQGSAKEKQTFKRRFRSGG